MKNNFLLFYSKNSEKILIFTIVILFTLVVVYIPYFNLILSSNVAFFVVSLFWYFLFAPSTKILAIISLIVLFGALVGALMKVNIVPELMGQVVYLLLIFILLNFAKEVLKEEKPQIK